MGYTTEFKGSFRFNRTPPRKLEQFVHDLGKKPHNRGPSIWCQWKLDRDWDTRDWTLCWDGNEKFYGYVEWLQLILDEIQEANFRFDDCPEGPTLLNGVVRWRGEDFDDIGYLEVSDNHLVVHRGYWPPVMVVDDRPPSNYPLPLVPSQE